jgi:hypothetical protein
MKERDGMFFQNIYFLFVQTIWLVVEELRYANDLT